MYYFVYLYISINFVVALINFSYHITLERSVNIVNICCDFSNQKFYDCTP